MNLLLSTIVFSFRNYKFNLKKNIRELKAYPWFFSNAKELNKSLKSNTDWKILTSYPCLLDKNEEGGSASGHYFHQDFWVAKQIYKDNPQRHIDIGSRIDGFVAHIAVFRMIEVIDVRPTKSKIENISFIQGNLMDESSILADCCDSVSCLHALEHFGLGRYGDPIDIDGHIKGFNNIHKMLKTEGTFYFSVPIGPQRLEYNAHRVFDLKYLIKMFKNKYIIENFSYVDDQGNMHENVKMADEGISNNYGCKWGCGIFKLRKQ